MTIRRLRIPAPWGNQPDDPSDSPFAVLVAERYAAEGDRDCLAGYDRRPPVPCLLGERAQCAWGVRSSRSHWCLWYHLEHFVGPGGLGARPELALPQIAKLLGVSRERARKLDSLALEKARCSGLKLKIESPD